MINVTGDHQIMSIIQWLKIQMAIGTKRLWKFRDPFRSVIYLPNNKDKVAWTSGIFISAWEKAAQT